MAEGVSFHNYAFVTLGEIFCDLGCGGGKACLAAAILVPFKQVHGIDLLQSSLAQAKHLMSLYRREYLRQESNHLHAPELSQDGSAHSNNFELPWKGAHPYVSH